MLTQSHQPMQSLAIHQSQHRGAQFRSRAIEVDILAHKGRIGCAGVPLAMLVRIDRIGHLAVIAHIDQSQRRHLHHFLRADIREQIFIQHPDQDMHRFIVAVQTVGSGHIDRDLLRITGGRRRAPALGVFCCLVGNAAGRPEQIAQILLADRLRGKSRSICGGGSLIVFIICEFLFIHNKDKVLKNSKQKQF